jgi:cytochrome c
MSVSLWSRGVGLMLALAWGGCSSDPDEPGPVDYMAPPFGAGAPGTGEGQPGSGGTGGSAAAPNPGMLAGNGQTPILPASPEGGSNLPLAPGVAPVGNQMPPADGSAAQPPPALENVLVFTRTLGFRHDSIGAGVEAIRRLGELEGFAVEQSEDPTLFSDEGLAAYDVVVWLSTTADVLGPEQELAFQRFIQAGGGWVGVHAAADTEYDWPWYGDLLGGAYFVSHPVIQSVQVQVENAEHASTAHLPARFSLQDELYNFRENPRAAASVLMTLDETSYQPGADAMGADHPIAWYHEFDGGRAWYTGLGHRTELYTDPLFTQHLLGGIRWAAGVAP